MKSKALFFIIGLFTVHFSVRAQLNREWLNEHPTPNSFTNANVVALFDAGGGNVVEATMLARYVSPDPTVNRLDLKWIAPSGTIINQVMYDHPVYEAFRVYQGGRDVAGNLYFSGYVSLSQSSTGWYVVSFDANGQFRWEKLNVDGTFTEGMAHSMAVSPAGDVYVGGFVTGGQSYGVLVKYDSNGNELWNHQVLSAFSYAQDLALSAGGGVVSVNQYDISRFSAAGQELWVSSDSGFYAGPDIVEAPDGSIYTLTYEGYLYHLRKFTPAGDLLWEYDDFAEYLAFGDNDVQVAVDAQGFVYCSGINSTDTSYSTAVAKFTPQGQQQWIQKFRDTPLDFYDVFDMLLLPGGGVVVSGIGGDTSYFSGTALLDGATGDITESDIVVIPGDFMQQHLMVRNSAGLYVAGSGGYSAYMAKYGAALSVNEEIDLGEWTVFPNPFGQQVSVQSDVPVQRYELYDITGQRIRQGNPNGNLTLATETLPAGTYLLRVWRAGKGVAVRKIVKK